MSTNTTIQLAYPITCPHQGQVTQLTLRRAKVRDLIAAQEGDSSPPRVEVRLFSILTGLAPATLEEMDEADYLRLQNAYAGFRKAGPATVSAPPSSGSAG